MRFEIEPEIFDLFPGMHIPAVFAEGIDGRLRAEQIEREWQQVWGETSRAAAEYGNSQSNPRVQPWRDRMKSAGFPAKKFPSSIESMLRRCLKGGDPFLINPLVNLYNVVSLRHVVPAGGFDIDDLEDERLDLRLTRAGDSFHALDSEEVEDVPAGEIAYCTGNDVLTRHFVWRQSKRGLLTLKTSRAIFMAEVLGEVGPDVAQEVLDDLCDGLQQQLGASVTGAMLSAAQSSFSFR